MVNEQTPLEDELEVTDLDEGTDDEVVDDAQDDNEPDELEVLRSKVEALEKNNAVVEDLKRTVGRIQSLATKFEAASSNAQRDDIQKQINERFSVVEDQLATLASGIDETAIDPATRQRILQAQEQARRAAEVQAEVEKALKARAPQPSPQPQVPNLETELVGMIEAAGLDPDGGMFDWGAMSAMWREDLSGNTIRQHVLNKIIEAKTEEQAASRRSTAKKQAGAGAPKQAAVTPNPAARMAQALDSGDLASAIAERNKLLQGLR